MDPTTITPLPLPPGKPAPPFIVLFGGTFDPPHRGHVDLPVRVRDELELRADCKGKGWLIVIPAARSPHKNAGPVATDAQRVEMLRLALQGVPRAAVWTDEIDRANENDPSFTIDTVHRARQWLDANNMPDTRLRLLIGADQAIGFHRWRDPREIVHLAPPAVMIRGEVADGEALLDRLGRARFWKRDERDMWEQAMVPVGRLDISATRVREALRNGDEGEYGRWLTPRVADYVKVHGLYRAH